MKTGPLPVDELARPLVEDADPENVTRQQIARELDAPRLAAGGPREGLGQRRLPDAGHVLDEHVAAADQRDERELDRFGFALERALDRRAELLQQR